MRREWDQLLSLKVLNFLFGGTMVLIGPFLPLYLVHQGFSPLQVGLILGVATFFGVLGQPYWAYMSDRYQTVKKILLFVYFFSFLLSVGLFYSHLFYVVMIFSILFYLVWTPAQALIDSLVIKTVRKGKGSYGKIRLWSSFGFAAIALIAGPLLESIGIKMLSIFFWIMLFTMIISLKPVSDHNESSRSAEANDVKVLLQNREFLWLLILLFILCIPNGFNSMFSLHMKELGAGEKL